MNDQQKSQLRNLIQSSHWGLLVSLKDKIISNIQSRSVVKLTNDETLRAAISKEAEMEALNNFIQEILRQAQ